MRRLVWLAVIFTVASAATSAQRLPLEINRVWESELKSVAPFRSGQDSVDELLVVLPDSTVEVRNQNLLSAGRTYGLRHEGIRAGSVVVGADDGGRKWVTFVQHDSAFINDLQRDTAMPVVVGHDNNKLTQGWDGGISQVEVLDIDADDRLEAIARVTSGWDMRPRGLYVLDWQTGERRWSFECGPGPTEFVLMDMDGDGKTEIIFGTWAPHNGNTASGMTDSLTYVVALGHDGRERWRQQVGCYSSQVLVQTLDTGNASGPVLVACEVGNPAGGRTGDDILLLNARDGTIAGRVRFGTFNRGFQVLSNVRGGPLVAVASSDDTLRVLTRHLDVVAKEHALGIGEQAPMCRGRFTGRKEDEIALVTSAGHLLVRDARLRPLADADIGAAGMIRGVRHGPQTRLLAELSSGGRRIWRLYEPSLLPVLGRRITLGTALSGLVLFAAAFVVALAGLRYRQTRDMRAVVRGLTGQAGVVELNSRGGVKRTNAKARDLLGGEVLPAGPLVQAVKSALAGPSGSQPKELPVVLESGKTVLARAARVRSGVMLTLEDISTVEYLKRVSTWVPVAQKLAHDIKNPLTAISLTLQRVERAAGPDSQRYVESMKDDIDRLKKMADGFMRLTKLEPPKLAPDDINEVVRQCAGKFESVKPAGVEFSYELAEGLPSVALDRDQMAVACSNIIENAISAMGDVGRLVVRTSFIVGDGKVVVSMSDTGRGIPERYLTKVFEPYFTLKPGGTGLGMALTKRIIEDHKGTIRIESREGIGTTVTIELPAAGTGSA
jgi:signal transduction histidine kinase